MEKKKVGLVLEGGSMRGMFTAGVIDVFMDEGIEIDGIMGVSAGAIFGPNYFSKQRGRVIRYNKRFCKDKRYMSFRNLFLTGNIIGKQFAFYDVTSKYDVFDNETFMQNNTGYYAVVTNVETGEAEYLEMKDIVAEMEVLRATSALPVFSEIIEVNGKKYLDGGISDSIPVGKMLEMGYDKIIVVLTRPDDYRKEAMSKGMLRILNVKYRKYPNFLKSMTNRWRKYNETIDEILELEKNGRIFVIRPSEPLDVKVIERDASKLNKVYEQGLDECNKAMESLKAYLEK
ncbi:MAG: patatin family protein [Firmicutes bacterium]|nr:patatin family protein [Bacillota bacterium]